MSRLNALRSLCFIAALFTACHLQAGESATAADSVATPAVKTSSSQQSEQWLEQARQAIAQGDNDRAILLYTSILEADDEAYKADALEFLGLARERKGQQAHAKATYEEYLKIYPSGEGAERVRQRLTALITARAPDQDKLRRVKPPQSTSNWDVRGGFSQYYRRDVSTTDATGDSVNQSALDNTLDASADIQRPDYTLRTRFSGSYDYSFLDEISDRPRITNLYVDAATRDREFMGRWGRQSRNSDGIMGRFDGVLFSYQHNPWLRVNLSSGYPVEIATIEEIATNMVFSSLGIDLGTFANAWDLNVYAIQQSVDDIVDRSALGGEVRYFKPNQSWLGLLDYDVHYQTLNTALVLGNWIFPDNAILNVVVDQRKSPLLSTRNALQGQAVSSLKELAQGLTTETIEQLARDRTADSRNYIIGLSRPLNNRLQISGEISLAELSGTPASGGVEAMPDSGGDWSYSLQMMASDLVKEGDISIAGLRYMTNDRNQTLSLNLNTRYPINDAWRVNPRLRIDQRHFSTDDSKEWDLTPSVRLNYQARKYLHLELEAGGSWSSREFTDESENTAGYFVNLGYRADF